MEIPEPPVILFTAAAVSLGGAWVSYLLTSKKWRGRMARFLRIALPDDEPGMLDNVQKVPTWLVQPDPFPRKEHYTAPFELAPDSMEAQVQAVLDSEVLDRKEPYTPKSRPRYHCEGVYIGLGYDQYGNHVYLLHPDDRKFIETVGPKRAGGDAVCEFCGYTFYQHPPVQGALALTRVCSRDNMGELVKL